MSAALTAILQEEKRDAPVAVLETACAEVKDYLAQPRISSYRFDPVRQMHTYEQSANNRRWVGGLHSVLKGMLPRDYKAAKRSSWKRARAKVPSEHKKGANKNDGISTMTFIEKTIMANGKRPSRSQRYAVAILDWLQSRGYDLQCAELPVILPWINRVTRADLVTLDCDRKGLVVWEIKCGWPPGATRGRFKFPKSTGLEKVPCHAINMFHLQAMLTKVGAEASGLSGRVTARVLHVYEAEFSDKIETPPAQRKRSTSTGGDGRGKEVHEVDWKKPWVDESKGVRYERVMRVVSYDLPKWCRDYEAVIRKKAGL